MKKILVLVCAMLISVSSFSQTPKQLKKWSLIIDAIAQIESGRNPKVVSKDGMYVGYLQIAPILVRECNRIVGYNKYTYQDRYSKDKSIQMFIDFQEHHNPEGNVEKAIRLWNSGDIKCMERKSKTEAYYQKVISKYGSRES